MRNGKTFRFRNVSEKDFQKMFKHAESFIENFEKKYFKINSMEWVGNKTSTENGDLIVALVEDSATVKTFYKEKDHIRLQPENSTMDPIIVPNCEILGKVAGVFRKM